MCNVLKPEFVADQIIQAIQENRNKVFLPKLFDILSLLKEILPREAMMTFLSWFGVLDAMNDVGRKKLKIKSYLFLSLSAEKNKLEINEE